MTKNDKVEDKEKKDETPFEHFENLVRKVIAVPKTEIERRNTEWQKQRKSK